MTNKNDPVPWEFGDAFTKLGLAMADGIITASGLPDNDKNKLAAGMMKKLIADTKKTQGNRSGQSPLNFHSWRLLMRKFVGALAEELDRQIEADLEWNSGGSVAGRHTNKPDLGGTLGT